MAPNLNGSWTEPLARDGKDRSHIPAQPLWTAALRIPQLIVALIVVILTGVAASSLGSGPNGFGLAWFSFAWTLLYFIWLGLSVFLYPFGYKEYIHLPTEILTNVFWLATWAVLASNASTLASAQRRINRLPQKYVNAINCVKAAAAMGALVWVLFCVSLAFLALSILSSHRFRSADPEAGAPKENELTATTDPGSAAAPAQPPATPQAPIPAEAPQHMPAEPQETNTSPPHPQPLASAPHNNPAPYPAN